MGWFDYLYKNIIAPFYLKRDNLDIFPHLERLTKSQYFSADEIEQIQLDKLQKILAYASIHNPYYKNTFEKNDIYVGDIKTLNDLKKLPILDKNDIKQNMATLISDDFDTENMVNKSTGGSTTVPLELFWTQEALTDKYATTLRHNSWANYDMGNKIGAIWGDPYQLDWKGKIRRKIYDRLIMLNALDISDEKMLDFNQQLNAQKTKILYGHAHALFIYAKFIADNKLKVPNIKGIITTAEILYDSERLFIESVFGDVVFNRYGCEELSVIASECEAHDGLHINAEGLIVEIEQDDPNEAGELIITDLVNYGMPFIRYRIGDTATFKKSDCSCKRNLPRLEKLHGRSTDFLYTPEGKKLSGVSILDHFAIRITGVLQVQLIQEELDRLVIKIVKDDNFGQPSRDELKTKIVKFFGEKMRYDLELVDKIPQTVRGKYQFSICNIKPPSNLI